eukprot:7136353-Prymnesium_polylepis.1
MQDQHLQLIKLIMEELRFAEAPERALTNLHAMHAEVRRAGNHELNEWYRLLAVATEKNWYKDANHYHEATNRVLAEQKAIFDVLKKRDVWEEDAIDVNASPGKHRVSRASTYKDLIGLRGGDANQQQVYRMQKCSRLSAAAGNYDGAIQLLKMSLHGIHDADNTGETHNDGSAKARAAWESLSYQSRQAVRQACEAEQLKEEEWWRLDVAQYIIDRQVSAPWPKVLLEVMREASRG